jgi:receptor expression-enhancing protein 5/6
VTLGITVVYPAVQSIKAIESHEKEDDKEWLTYWIIFGLITLIDDLFGWILAFIPYYSLIKIGFFLYLFVPYFKGALKIYNVVVKPLLV